MARKVIKIAHGPFEVKPQTSSVWICMCGLSKNQPFCDRSHLKTLDEDDAKLYEYDESGNRYELKSPKDCDCECNCDKK